MAISSIPSNQSKVKRKYIIYKITNLKNGKIYIGQTIRTIHLRKLEHLKYARHGCQYCLHRAIRKHGGANFIFELQFYCMSKEEMYQKEIELINSMNCRAPYGYNLTDGGKGPTGQKMSKEAKAKIGRAVSMRVVTDETREKLRIANTGKKMSIEARTKISEVQKGRKASEKTKARMSKSAMGRICTKETREKIKAAKTGSKMSAEIRLRRMGFKATDEAKANMKEAWKKRKQDYGPTGKKSYEPI